LGFDTITGKALSSKLEQHVSNQKAEFLVDEYVVGIIKEGNDFKITTDKKKTIQSKTILITTVGSPRKINVLNENKFAGRGVSYCTICDAPFFEGKDVIVVGGGNGAMDSVLDLVPWAKSITLVHRSQFRADQYLIDKVKEIPKLKIHLETEIKEMYGRDQLESITIW